MRALIPRREGAVQPAPRRRRRFSPWRLATWTVLAAPWAALAGVVLGAGWLIWSEGGPGSLAAKLRSEALLASLRLGFEVNEVWVDGLKRADRDEVLQAVGAVRGEPILEFDAQAARARLIALPWIKDAVVALALPRQVHVALTEREPLALWQMQGSLAVIDHDGKVIPSVDPAHFAHLPILVGKGADAGASGLLTLVGAAPEIARRMTAAVFVGERRWNLRIDDRIDVRLPADAPDLALLRLVDLEREHGLLGKDIIAIDLRLDDRLIVRVAPGAAMPGLDDNRADAGKRRGRPS